jgi:hypothetical protein
MWDEAYDAISRLARDRIRWLGEEWIREEMIESMPADCERLEGCLVEQCEALAQAWMKRIQDATGTELEATDRHGAG